MIFCGQNWRKNPVCNKENAYKLLKQCISDELCKKRKSLGSGLFPRDGRVTGNKHLFCLGLILHAFFLNKNNFVRTMNLDFWPKIRTF